MVFSLRNARREIQNHFSKKPTLQMFTKFLKILNRRNCTDRTRARFWQQRKFIVLYSAEFVTS